MAKSKVKDDKEIIDPITGELFNDKPAFNERVTVVTQRRDGTRRIQHFFDNCPTLTEQHTAHLSDLNYLMDKYQPDELANYIAARNQYRQEILNHDFSAEPSLQDSMNVVYKSKQNFENLSPDIKKNFRNHVEFLKFIDNPDNKQKMISMGILKPDEIKGIEIPIPNPIVEDANIKTDKK